MQQRRIAHCVSDREDPRGERRVGAGRAAAQGPGRSAAVSTSELNVSGMQKMLTSLPGLAAPPVVSAPETAPVSTIVRAMLLDVKAPEVRCPQLVKPGDCV